MIHVARERLATLVFFGALCFGCNTAPAKPSLMANMAKEALSVYELRAMDYEYASRFAQLVALSTSHIIKSTDDLLVRERALRWRLWAMPEARSAAFDQDPFAGLIELWILAHQQHQYFSEGPGQSWFGDQQPHALEATSQLRDMAEQLMTKVINEQEADRMREVGSTWVDAHPIEGDLYVRPTARADLATFVSDKQHGGLRAVGSIEETTRDLSDRITILSAQAPLEARWQAEYLVEALFEERVHDRVDAVVGSLDNLASFVDAFEDTLSAQTQSLLSGIEEQRVAVFSAIETERIAVLEAIEREREEIVGELDAQWGTASAELESVGKELIDHFFSRLIQVLVVTGIVVFLIVLLVLAVVRRRASTTIDRTPPSE